MSKNFNLWFRFLCTISRAIQRWPVSWRLNQFLYQHTAGVAAIGNVVLSPRPDLSIEVSGETSVNILIEGLAVNTPAIQLLELISETGACIMDIGANIGLVSIILSRLVGKNGHIYAFEALPATAELLQRNINRNRCENVTVYTYAVSNRCGEITFYEAGPGKSEVSSIRPRPGNSITVPTIMLDAMMPKLSRVDIVKIDVEGAEYLVLDLLVIVHIWLSKSQIYGRNNSVFVPAMSLIY